MTTPAVNENILTFNFYTVSYEDGTPPETSSITNRRRWRQRPESKLNPIRPDKTRAPSNWIVEYGLYEWFRGSAQLAAPNPIYSRRIDGVVGTGMNNGDWMPDLADASSYLQNCRLAALASGTDKAKQLNAALAQANQTARMVGDGARGIAHSLNGLMQGPKGLFRELGGMSSWKKLPSKYLEWLYGWRPLGDDIANAFDKLNSYKDQGFNYSMLLKKKRSVNESIMHDMSWMYGVRQAEVTPIVGRRTIRVACNYRFDLPRWFLENTPVISPWGPLYEITPYSFVADWFIPIGAWIGSMEAAQFSPHFVEGSETASIRDVYRSGAYNGNFGGGYSFTASGKGNIDAFRMRRLAIDSFPQTVTSPPAINPLPGLQEAAQGLALLSQAFNRWR